MSRRPIAANPVQRRNDVRRRMWSESPVPRVASRRVRSTSGAPVVPPGNMTFGPKSGAFSLGVADVGSATVDLLTHAYGIPGTYQVPGDEVVVLAFGVETGWAAPTGWHTVASGSAGVLDWIVARRVLTGSDSGEFTLSNMSPGWSEASGDKGTWTIIWWRMTGSSGGRWHAEASTSTGTSATWWTPSSSWWDTAANNDPWWAWNAAACLPLTTSDDIAYYNDKTTDSRDRTAWVYGHTRRMFSFYFNGYAWFESPDAVRESTPSTSGSRFLQVAIGWTAA